jgi:hypothetical protein
MRSCILFIMRKFRLAFEKDSESFLQYERFLETASQRKVAVPLDLASAKAMLQLVDELAAQKAQLGKAIQQQEQTQA